GEGLRGSDQVKAIYILGILLDENTVITQSSGDNRNAMQRAIFELADKKLGSLGERVELIARSNPMLAGAAGVAGDDHLHRDAVRRSQHAHQPKYWARPGILPTSLPPSIGNVAPLISLRVIDRFQIFEACAPAVGHPPGVAAGELAAERFVNLL